MVGDRPITVVATPEFLWEGSKILTDEERTALVDYLANNPTAGERLLPMETARHMKTLTAFISRRESPCAQYGRSSA
jgi:hypothetical protein